MKIWDQEKVIPYRAFDFEGGKMIASRMGMPFERVEEQLFETDFLGLSINPTCWSNIALDFARYAKKINPRIIIIIGGTEAMFRYEHYLQSGVIDFVIRGEGEITGPALIDALIHGKDYLGIKGLAFVQVGKIVETGIMRNCDLNKEPASAIDLFYDDVPLWDTPIEYYRDELIQTPTAHLYITRGCNQACEYCTTPRKYGRLRFKSLERVRKELQYFKKSGIKSINVWDDSLSSLVRHGKRDLLISYIRMIRQYGFPFEYAQSVVIRDLWDFEKCEPDFELIHELYSHELVNGEFIGCYGQYTPLEFLQEENTTAMDNKLLAFEKELEVIKSICEQGVRYLTFPCILGRSTDGPNQISFARKRLLQIVKLVEGYSVKVLITPYLYSIFPGTKIWQKEKDRLEYSIEDYPELFQFNASPHGTDYFTPGELMQAKLDLEREFLGEERFDRWIRTGRYQW
ncbi:cobalamin B12-binding domain-containing protein [Candidatus Kuenenbacteria bacterium]|nr:cobalamin B12-binding domain-containing protein [Candidatus Kuenenbacteria bacterium]